MPHLMGVTLPPGISNYYNRVATIYNRKVKCIVGVKPDRKPRKYGNTARANSTLKVTSAVWKTYNPTLKAAWKAAAVFEGKTGYNLFTKDQCYRIKNAIVGSATPSTFHQFFIGQITKPGDADYLLLKAGRTFRPTKNMTLTVNAKGALSFPGLTGSVNLRVAVKRYFIGQTFTDYFYLPLDLVSDWKSYSLAITNGDGSLATCDLYLEFNNVNGSLYIDNLELMAGGNVLNDDPWCNNIESSFKVVGDPLDWLFSSIYPPDGL